MSVCVNCSPPRLKHCFLFWSSLAYFNLGQGFSLVHRTRSCVCNRGITCNDRLVEKAVCAETDQTGAFPLKSTAGVTVCILLPRVTFSCCPGVCNSWTNPPCSLVLRWMGSLNWKASWARGPGLEIQNSEYWHLRLFKPWAWLWSFVRNWQCMTTESWGTGIIHSLYSSFFFWLLPACYQGSQEAEGRRRGKSGHGFPPSLLMVLLKDIWWWGNQW